MPTLGKRWRGLPPFEALEVFGGEPDQLALMRLPLGGALRGQAARFKVKKIQEVTQTSFNGTFIACTSRRIENSVGVEINAL